MFRQQDKFEMLRTQKKNQSFNSSLEITQTRNFIKQNEIFFPNFLHHIKQFIIEQNIKKFVNKLLGKIQHLKFFNQTHLQIVNDKGAQIQNEKQEKNYLDLLLEDELTQTKKQSQFDKKLRRMQRRIIVIINRNKLFVDLYQKICYVYINVVPIFQPEMQITKFFSSVILFIKLFYIFTIPLDIAYQSKLLVNDLFFLNNIFQIIFFINIFFNFTKATFLDGQLMKTRKQIYQSYLKGDFKFDLISLASLIFSTWLTILYQSFFYEFILLIFFLQIKQLIQQRDETYEINRKKKHFIQFISLLIQILLAEHLFSCLFFFFSSILEMNGGILKILYYFLENITFYSEYLSQLNWQRQYIETLYFSSTTMITVGYGDLSPKNTYEKIMCIFFMLASSIQLSYSVNTIGSIIQEINLEAEENQAKIRLITSYMEDKNITPKLQINIREYLKYFWQEQELESKFSQQQKIISSLPENLLEKLHREVNNTMLINCPLFQNKNYSKEFYNNVSKIIQEVNLMPEQLIENSKQTYGISGPCIFYVEKGEIDAIAQTGNTQVIINKWHIGDYFGLEDFLQDLEKKVIYKSTKFSRIFIIPRSDFLKTISQDDKEIFLMVKDEHQFDYCKLFKPFCQACIKTTHSLEKCPYTHYIADQEKIIKQYCFNNMQERKKKTRSLKKYKNQFYSLMDQKFISECSEVYRLENQQIIDNLYEDDLSDVSSNESETEEDEKLQKKIEKNEQKHNHSQKILKKKTVQIETNEITGDSSIHKMQGDQIKFGNRMKFLLRRTRFSAKLEIFNIDRKISQPRRLDMIHQLDLNENRQRNISQAKFQNTINNTIYFNERLMLGQLEKQKYIYENKMAHFLKKSDYLELNFLLIRLRMKRQIDDIFEDFDRAQQYIQYKPQENLKFVIENANMSSKQQNNNSNQNLRLYLLFPYQFSIIYQKNKLNLNQSYDHQKEDEDQQRQRPLMKSHKQLRIHHGTIFPINFQN